MTINIKQILIDLNKHASEFNFPVLDNAYVEYAGSRMSAFQGNEDWLLVFEVLGFSTREGEFVEDLYAYGTCADRQGFISERVLLSSDAALPLFDQETNQCIADWTRWSIRLEDETLSFSPSREEYAHAGVVLDRVPGPGTLREIELLRFLINRLGENRFFMNDQALLSHFPRCRNFSKFLQTTRWQHPDVAGGEKPSESTSLRSLIEALSIKDPSAFNEGIPNTDWKFWAGGPESNRQEVD